MCQPSLVRVAALFVVVLFAVRPIASCRMSECVLLVTDAIAGCLRLNWFRHKQQKFALRATGYNLLRNSIKQYSGGIVAYEANTGKELVRDCTNSTTL